MSRNNVPTFSNRYEITQINFGKGRQMIIKADRNLLHRLIVAYEASRKVDLQGLSKHKLMPVPICIAEMNGVLRTTSKPMLGDVLISGITCSSSSRPEGSLAGQALVNAVGKPAGNKTFGDLADMQCDSNVRNGYILQQDWRCIWQVEGRIN